MVSLKDIYIQFPKGNLPFEIIHIDHFGPADQASLKKYILLVVNAFSKFVRLFATKTTNAKETICYLQQFFQSYNKPKVVISDRGSAFTSIDFGNFLKEQDVQHIKIAVGPHSHPKPMVRPNASIEL